MTKEEFIKGYAERSNMTEEKVMEVLVALPCNCGEDDCEGWAMVGNNPLNIKAHNELYNN